MKNKKALKSKFRFIAYIQPILLVLFVLLIILAIGLFVLTITMNNNDSKSLIYLWLYLPITSLIFFYISVSQLYICRYRCDAIEIVENDIHIKNFFGLGKLIVIKFKDAQIVKTIESVKIGTGEKIMIYYNNCRVTVLSDFFHSNYDLLKTELNGYSHNQIIDVEDENYWNKFKLAFRC